MSEEEIRADERIKTGKAIKKLLEDAIENYSESEYIWCKNTGDESCMSSDCRYCHLDKVSREIDELIGLTDCYEKVNE